MATVNHMLNVEAGSLLLLDEATEELAFVMTLEGGAERLANFKIKIGEGIAGWVAQHGKPLLISDVKQDARFFPVIDKITGFKTQTILCVPLRSRQHTLGVLEVINKRGEDGTMVPFSQDDLHLLNSLASWVTVAVENARLNKALQDKAAVKTLRQTVIALAHHINNILQVFALELDTLEEMEFRDPDDLAQFAASARGHMKDIVEVMRALDKVQEIHIVNYGESATMLDLGIDFSA